MIHLPEKIYDRIGVRYNQTRAADPNILNEIEKRLNSPLRSVLIDAGAGTGNYSYELAEKGYVVHAVEPSELMQKQKKIHPNLKWNYGVAEHLSFRDNTFDGAVVTLAVHHFRSVPEAIQELHRVLKKKARLVIFTADPDIAQPDNWFKEYFGPLFPSAFKTYPKKDYLVDTLERIFENNPEDHPFHLPENLIDGFFYSAWKYPERYLDEEFRNGISVFAKSGRDVYLPLIMRLEMDLRSRVWDKKYGYIKKLKTFDGGYFFLTVQKK